MSLEKDAVHFRFGQLKRFSQGVLRPPVDRLYAQDWSHRDEGNTDFVLQGLSAALMWETDTL